jgi:hypothetical protein
MGFRGSVQFTSLRRRLSETPLADIDDGSNFLGYSQKGKRGELSGKLGRHCIGPLPGPTGRTNDAKKRVHSSDALQAILLLAAHWTKLLRVSGHWLRIRYIVDVVGMT